VALAWQDSLFADERPRLSFDGISRVQLDEYSWLDIVASWLPRHAELFELLHETAPWQQRERHMYDKRVLEPRLVAAWSRPELDTLPDQLKEVRQAVADRYNADFDSVLVNLYRDGRDGVAWHGDTVRKRLPEAVVVTVGLGERRRFLLRRGTSGPVLHEMESGQGDLIVMGGRCQHDWQHTVPKSARAGARMSVTMRHSAPLRREDAQSTPGDAGGTE
jgi:alkylated DNA repair dioxygenase AlkB